jgi:phospholipase/lecithinase/hemolysin
MPIELGDVFAQRHVLLLEPVADMLATGPETAASFYFPDDGHPTRAGNEFVARYLVSRAALDR